MAMLEYNPPTDPWIDVVFEDEQILAVNKHLVCFLCRGVLLSITTVCGVA
ncbi:ribosomal large subunit pseudouridine synthase A [Vibrio sp. JCM 19052]|nr:ribosomal large subunit pseudouridine synthase A [Vibrio sp. JCM 19052]